MRNTWKIYMLAFIGFVISTSEYVIPGILDKVAASAHISVSAAGQLITVFTIANAKGSSMLAISWIGAASVAIAVCMAAVSFSLSRSTYKSIATK